MAADSGSAHPVAATFATSFIAAAFLSALISTVISFYDIISAMLH
jgi:hypothetical protein